MADKTAFLIGDADLDGGDFVMVAYDDGFRAKMVALFGTRDKYNAVVDAYGELASHVHQSCDGKVS